MPIIDMPLEELQRYQGTNPRPEDFDEYWDKALAEMQAVDPEVELIPSDFQVPSAECFDLYFTGVRGARIHAKYLRPRGAVDPHPAVLMFHGYGGNGGIGVVSWPTLASVQRCGTRLPWTGRALRGYMRSDRQHI